MTGLTGEYHKIRADSSVLAQTVDGLRGGQWSGLNVTMPLKKEAARLSDELDATASRSGSVNTLVLVGGRVVGYSTDTMAFQTLLKEPGMVDSDVLVLGAGGSAAAALAALAERKTYVASRRVEQARDLCDRLGGAPIPWGEAVNGALVINTTPLGMKGESLPATVLEAASALIDLPYGDTETPAIALASRIGLPARDGHEFLVRQAVDSFSLWTGAGVDVEDLSMRLRNN